MGFYFRLAPGVKVRVTSGGVRTSIGPRAARLHVGAGGAGISTGAGPVTYYAGIPSSRRGTSSPPYRDRRGASGQTTRAGAEKAAQAQLLKRQFDAISGLNDVNFPTRTRPLAPPPAPVDLADLQRKHRAVARQKTSIFKPSARREALHQADELANTEAERVFAEATEEMYRRQEELDSWWSSLQAGDPPTVLAALAQSFEDNDAIAAAVGLTGTGVSLVMVAPPATSVPDRKPATTNAGNLSLKKLTKSERTEIYKEVVAGHVLLTVREAFAVVPALTDARILVLRTAAAAQSGEPVEPILAARFERSALERLSWRAIDAVQVMNDHSEELILREKGVARELQPIDLSAEPELAAAIKAVDFEEIARHGS